MNRPRILVVDDNADNRYMMRLLLSGYEVLEAASGPEALTLTKSKRPDCILLDVQMPVMDGFAVCRELRADEQTRSIPVILVTARHKDTESVVKGLAAGGDDYVTKPVAQQELLARVRAMLRIHDLQQQLESLNLNLEEQVRRRTEELRQVYATVPVGLYSLDAHGRVTSVNRHLLDLLGYAGEEVIGLKTIADLFAPGYDLFYWLDLCRREGRVSYQTEAQHRSGERIPVFDERVVLTDHLGERVGYTGYLQDLRQRRRMETVLKDQEAQAGLGRLASGIVHEVLNPIGGVQNYLDSVAGQLEAGEEIPPEQMREGVKVMRDALHRTSELLSHLRGFARPTVHPTEAVDVASVLHDLRALMLHDLHRHGVEMVLRCETDAAFVKGDAGRLSQVFLNLLTNARDAMPEGGTLTVEVRAKDSTVLTRFQDTGTGIPAEDLARIFEFLYTTKGTRGTGFGLTISREIVSEHGGRIEVESREGEGTTFTVVLPRT